jgi:hypothetical protein
MEAEAMKYFRTKLVLEDGSTIYESRDWQILLRPMEIRDAIRQIHAKLLGYGDVAFSYDLNSIRPMWAFPPGSNRFRIIEFQYEPDDDPLDEAASRLGMEDLSGRLRVSLL